MTPDAWIMIGLLAVMLIFLIQNRIPTWLVFIGALTISMTIGIASEEDIIKGFSNKGVLTVAVLFPVAAGMYSTGAITIISNRVIGRPGSLGAAQAKIFPPVAVASAFLNNTPLVAMMIPVVRDIARNTRLDSSRIYMPLSFVSILGGAATVIGTSVNLIIAGMFFSQTEESLNIFFPSLIGIPAAFAGILFLMTIGKRLLPKTKKTHAADVYKRRFCTDFAIEKGSPVDGKTAGESGLFKSTGYAILAVHKADGTKPALSRNLKLEGGDIITFTADADAVPELWSTVGLLPPYYSSVLHESPRHTHRLVEVVISDQAGQIGRKISEMPSPESRYQLRVVGVSRSGQPPEGRLLDQRIEAGDTVIIEVDDTFFYENRRETDCALIKQLRGFRIKRVERAAIAAVITMGMITLTAFGIMSMLNAALLAVMAMLFTGCLSPRRAFESIDWETVIVMGAAIGLAAAVTESGLSEVIVNGLTRIGGGNFAVALTAVFIGSVLLANVINHSAAAALMFPVTMGVASGFPTGPAPFIAILMLGCSYSFINPASYQTNLMVKGPGGYTFMDFVKVGVPLTLVSGLVAIMAALLVY